MGHSKASKGMTHARLVAAAAARFKERGVDGISLSDLMKDLKLTHGGFYRHFDSRDELVAEALDLGLKQCGRTLRDRLFAGETGENPQRAEGGAGGGWDEGRRCAPDGAAGSQRPLRVLNYGPRGGRFV